MFSSFCRYAKKGVGISDRIIIMVKVMISYFTFQLKERQNSGQENTSSLQSTSAQIKLVLIFCTYGLATMIIYTTYSVVLKYDGPFTQALEEYIECESSGNYTIPCSREIFEEFDPTPVTLPIVDISYSLLPISTLVYMANVEKLLNKIRNKFLFLTRSTVTE